LLCGDHPQAFANDIWLFGRRRGTGETIWDVKRQVGLFSPELHLYFPMALTAAEAAASGFIDTMVPHTITVAQAATVDHLFAQLGIGNLKNRPFVELSTGQQRLVLLVRALVKRPPLVILDEPFQGLDDGTIVHFRAWLDRHLSAAQTLLFVTHYPGEVPASVRRRLYLNCGRATTT